MTKPITHRPLRRSGRKAIVPPASAADRIRALAADGFSLVGVAADLGVSKDTLRGWMEREPHLQDAFEQGRETERRTLHNHLYRMATEKGNAAAAMFLLKARHGYREGDQSDQANRVSISIALPGAMTLQQFTQIGKEGTNG